MSNSIHPSAIVDPGAELAEDIHIGPYSVIGPKVKLGARTRIHNHATVMGDTTIGEDCEIFPGAVIGGPPQDMKYQGGPSKLLIGHHNIFRECCTVNSGTELGGGQTVIGSHNAFLAYTHIAHDCLLADRLVLANMTQVAGHCHIEEGARIMGLAGIHQFVRIGRGALVAGFARLSIDVPPHCMAVGQPAKIHNLNLEGLKRRGHSEEEVAALKRAFRMVFRGDGTRIDAYKAITSEELDKFILVGEFIEALRQTDKGRHGRGLEALRVDIPPNERDGRIAL